MELQPSVGDDGRIGTAGIEGYDAVARAVRADGQITAQPCRRREPHCDPAHPTRIADPDDVEHSVSAHRHRAQPVREQEVESGRAGDIDVEVMGRPVSGHLGVAPGSVVGDVMERRAAWVGEC